MNQTQTLAEFLPANVFAVMLVFVRIGGAIMLLPGFGDAYVPARYRLLLAIFLSLILTTSLAPLLPPAPAQPAALVVLLGGEIAIGLFFGVVARTLLAALDIAGNIISFQLGLSAAQITAGIAATKPRPVRCANRDERCARLSPMSSIFTIRATTP